MTGAPRRTANCGLALQSASVSPLIASAAPSPPDSVSAKRRARARSICLRQQRIRRQPLESRALRLRRAGAGEDDQRLVGVACGVVAQRKRDRCVGDVEDEFEARARAHGKDAAQRRERRARLAVDGDDQRRCAGDGDRHRPRRRGVGEAQTNARARRSGEPLRRGRRAGGDEGPGRPGIVSQAARFVEPPIAENDDRLEIDGGRRGLFDDDRAEQTRGELARGRRAGVGQVEVEAGVRRREANLGLAAGFDRRLGEAGDAGEGVGDSQARKAQRRRRVEAVGQAERQLFAALEPEERSGNGSVVSEQAGRRGGRGRERERSGGGGQPARRRRRSGVGRAAPGPNRRGDAAEEDGAAIEPQRRAHGQAPPCLNSGQPPWRGACGPGGL